MANVPRFRVTWQAVACALILALSIPALSKADDTIQFDIASQPLSAALKSFAEQAKMQILYRQDVVAGAMGNAVIGSYDKRNALQQLIKGTGLEIVFSADNAATIRTKSDVSANTQDVAKGEPITFRLAQNESTQSTDNKSSQTSEGSSKPSEDRSVKFEEITVTAQRYEQSLQQVPISVTVLTGENLAARGATQLEDVQYTVPGLSSFQYAPGRQFIQLRGVASTFGPSTIGQYIDEMPFTGDGSFGAIDIRMLDLERVEVLRGPQPTLYGESSMGGTVHYVTAPPQLTGLSSALEAEAGAVKDGAESYKINGMVNIPLRKDVLGLRLVGGYQEDGGWIDNRTTGVEDQNGLTVKTLRGTLLFRPTPQTGLSVMVLHQELDQDNQNFGLSRSALPPVTQFAVDDYDLVNGVVSHSFAGGANFTYSLGYLDRVGGIVNDVTPFYLGLVTGPLGFPPGFIDQIALVQTPLKSEVITHEVRLSSQDNDFFNWLVGGYSRDSKVHNLSRTITSPGSVGFDLIRVDNRSKSQSWAAFGDVSFKLTAALNLLLGARYYEDERETANSQTTLGFSSTEFNSGKFDSVNPRLNLRYEISPTAMVYFNAAKGFRSGGFNSQAAGGGVFTVPPTFDPDELLSYEIGTRNQLMDGRLLLEGAVYHNDWRNVQSRNFLGTSASTVVTNGGNASGWGVDLSATLIPVEGLTLTATYGWNNMEYDSDTADKNPGDPLDFVVPVSYSASVDYRRPLFGNKHGFVRLDYQHADDAQITIRGFLNDQIIPMPGRDLLNVRTGLEFGAVEVSVFVNNVLDEDAPVVVGPFGVLLENVEQRPRTVGLTLRTRF